MMGEAGRTLASFRNAHRGGSIIVCGCGVSLGDLARPEAVVTIGVNDVGRRFHPDYLVVLNPPEQFSDDRYQWVAGSRARYLFTQLDLPAPHPEVVKFRLGAYGGTDCWADDDALHYTRNSPYVALCLAAWMGAERIGLIGVDFTDDHFFGRTGGHPLTGFLPAIDEEYRRLGAALRARGVSVYNLSRTSRLTAFPRMSVDEFVAPETARASATGLRVVSYATTPLAGVPAILARCITARTPHGGRCVWARATYGNGVTFDGDIEWTASPAEAEAALAVADLVIVHNGKVEPRHRALLRGKAVVTLAHNYGWNVDTTLVEEGAPGLVVGQYQATLPEFAGWQVVPNPIPLWEAAFQPAAKGSIVSICYTPSGRHERYPRDHRLYWHSKGYDTTMRALDELSRQFTVRVEALGAGQVSHARSLAMKQGAHVVIDECVTGSYHRNSLEGLAAGCVVVNGMGGDPDIVAALARCTLGEAPMPFVRASLADLRDVLGALASRGPEALAADGSRSRQWMEAHWDFGRQWERFWMPAVEAALRRRHGKGAETSGGPMRGGDSRGGIAETDGVPPSVMRRRTGSVSVVVPHGGAERLGHLGFTLANLAQCGGVLEVIVAEMGEVPRAAELARRWDTRYVFVGSPGTFERARALNVGSAIASGDLILWKDNDLVMGTEFVARAAAEARDRNLDYLVPYHSIGYLSESDTRDVLAGTLDPAAVRPVKTLFSGRDVSGGAGMVRKDFVLRYGGMTEGFRGWGGEDNAWLHKVMLLGEWGVTRRRDQHLLHLFHPGSGAHLGRPPDEDPDYAGNLRLLHEIKAIHTRERFLERFPPGPPRCPWPPERHIELLTSIETPAALVRRRASVECAFRQLFDVRLEPRCLDGDGVPAAAGVPDAVVVMGRTTAARWLSTGANTVSKGRAVVVLDAEPSADSRQGLEEMAVILAPPEAEGALALAASLTGPLSLALGRRDEAPMGLRSSRTLPVWMYWEGDRPAWIARCEQTVRAHAPDVRRLGWAEFDRLWDRDLDLDIRQLTIAHRADFIRAFLLARFGGLWIDADCVVMQSLEPTLRCLESVDFVGHRDRQGFIPNGFIGARPGSAIAEALYRRICDILRSRRPLGWISLGGEPLTEIVQTTSASWRELPCEAIQPICWSQPGAFFETGPRQEHARRFSERALCYMLSNSEIKKWQAAHPSRDLLEAGTFFRYVVERSLGTSAASSGHAVTRVSERDPQEAGTPSPMREVFREVFLRNRQAGAESVSGPGSGLVQTAEIRRRLPGVLQHLGVSVLLDAPCGDFHWMRTLALGIGAYIGVDIVDEIVALNRERYGGPGRWFLQLDLASDPLPRADLILCRDCLGHFAYRDVFRALDNFRSSGSRYLMATSFPALRANTEAETGDWRPLNLEQPPFNLPPPLVVVNERCTEAQGRYADKSLGVWELGDLPL